MPLFFGFILEIYFVLLLVHLLFQVALPIVVNLLLLWALGRIVNFAIYLRKKQIISIYCLMKLVLMTKTIFYWSWHLVSFLEMLNLVLMFVYQMNFTWCENWALLPGNFCMYLFHLTILYRSWLYPFEKFPWNILFFLETYTYLVSFWT